MGARHTRYRGLARTHLQHITTPLVINLRRLAAWLMCDRPWLPLYDFTKRVEHGRYPKSVCVMPLASGQLEEGEQAFANNPDFAQTVAFYGLPANVSTPDSNK